MILKTFPRCLSSIFLEKISSKLALWMSVLVFLLLLLMGVVLTAMTANVVKENIKNSHEEIASLAADQVSVFMRRPFELLDTAGKLIGRIHSRAWDQETILVEMSLDFPMFQEIVSVNRAGVEIASSNLQRHGKNRSSDLVFRQVLKSGKPHFSEVTIGSDHLPYLTLSVPYFHMGTVVGMLIAEVNLREVWDIVDRIRVGQTGRALLLASNGLVVAHPDKRFVLRNAVFSTFPDFNKMISGKLGSTEYWLKKKKFFTSYAPVGGSIPLFIVIEREESEAFGLLNRLDWLIWFVLILSLSFSVLINFILAAWLVRPILLLQGWSKKVAMGDFDFKILPQSVDEIGRLFIMFKRMSKRLKQAREKERQAALGAASSAISHKLKNSIVALKTFAQLLPQRRHDPIFMKKFERNFTSTVFHLEDIFNNLSHMTSSRKSLIEAVSMPLLVQSVYEIYKEQMEKYGIVFNLDIEGRVTDIRGDVEQLRELITNLVQNAIQSMLHGGVLTVTLVYGEMNQQLQLNVSDTGMGICDEDLSQIFKPFFTTRYNGMGLGLSICKKIIEDHHGSIHVTSQIGIGSVFMIRLPIAHEKILDHKSAVQSKTALTETKMPSGVF